MNLSLQQKEAIRDGLAPPTSKKEQDSVPPQKPTFTCPTGELVTPLNPMFKTVPTTESHWVFSL